MDNNTFCFVSFSSTVVEYIFYILGGEERSMFGHVISPSLESLKVLIAKAIWLALHSYTSKQKCYLRRFTGKMFGLNKCLRH